MTTDPEVLIESFGYLHPDDRIPPQLPVLLVDLRLRIRDPHTDPTLVSLTGKDERVIEHVMSQPGAFDLLEGVRDDVLALLGQRRKRLQPVDVWVGCNGGRHRSVVVADAVGEALAGLGVHVKVIHRHIDRPVVKRR